MEAYRTEFPAGDEAETRLHDGTKGTLIYVYKIMAEKINASTKNQVHRR